MKTIIHNIHVLAGMSVIFAPTALLRAQTTMANYVKTETMLSANGTRKQTTVQYYDKKGRPSQLVTDGVGQTGYVRSYTEYNAWGRISKASLPMDAGSTPAYVESYDLMSESSNTYNGDEYGWTEYQYDAIGRETSALGPGFEWFDDERDIRHYFKINDDNSVYKYGVGTADGSLSSPNTYYNKGDLHSVAVYDEDWNCVETFIDRLGLPVLERRGSTGNYTDTYFIHDELGRLRIVLTPNFQEDGDIATTAYTYKYDGRGRITEKTLPGCEPTSYGYDSRDRLTTMQDATLRKQGLSRFYLYDGLGHLCVQGTCTATSGDGQDESVSFDKSQPGISGSGYNSPCLNVITNPEIEIVNYYGRYDFTGTTLFDACPDKDALLDAGTLNYGTQQVTADIDTTHIHGLLTGRIVKLSDGSMRYSAMFYDYRGRLVRTNDVYSDGRTLSTVSSLSFTGKPECTVTVLKNDGQTYSTCTTYTYDSKGDKLTKTTLSVNGQNTHTTANIIYDAVGRVESVTREGTQLFIRPITPVIQRANIIAIRPDSSIHRPFPEIIRPSLTTNYTRNIRGWTTGISAPGFKQTLLFGNYEVMDGSPMYNGNIPNIEWTGVDGVKHCYYFSYDDCNRLTHAYYEGSDWSEPEDKRYSLHIDGYDPNGNITAMRRYGLKQDGTFGLVDDLTITYNGNQPVNATDHADPVNTEGSTDFKDGNNGYFQDYTFNGVGALTSDKNKNITYIEYDKLNLPRKILVESDAETGFVSTTQEAATPQPMVFVIPMDSTKYTYTPDGEKIRVTHVVNKSIPFVSTDPTRPVWPTRTIKIRDTTEYIGPFVICNVKLDKVLFNGGYVTFGKTDLSEQTYHYFSTDHQGNVRAVYDEAGNIEQSIAYDPFGVIIPDLSTGTGIQPYLYNGKELDRVHGLNWYDYGARMYDVTLGRWTTVDPLCEKYYHVSPYAYCGNNPVNRIDPDGRVIVFALNSSDEFKNAYYLVTKYLTDNGCGNFLKILNDAKEIYTIKESDKNSFLWTNRLIEWNPNMGLDTGFAVLSPATRLNHELDHAAEYQTKPNIFKNNIKTIPDGNPDSPYHTMEEKRVITGSEKDTATALGEIEEDDITRNGHGGIPVKTESPISNKAIDDLLRITITPEYKK